MTFRYGDQRGNAFADGLMTGFNFIDGIYARREAQRLARAQEARANEAFQLEKEDRQRRIADAERVEKERQLAMVGNTFMGLSAQYDFDESKIPAEAIKRLHSELGRLGVPLTDDPLLDLGNNVIRFNPQYGAQNLQGDTDRERRSRYSELIAAANTRPSAEPIARGAPATVVSSASQGQTVTARPNNNTAALAGIRAQLRPETQGSTAASAAPTFDAASVARLQEVESELNDLVRQYSNSNYSPVNPDLAAEQRFRARRINELEAERDQLENSKQQSYDRQPELQDRFVEMEQRNRRLREMASASGTNVRDQERITAKSSLYSQNAAATAQTNNPQTNQNRDRVAVTSLVRSTTQRTQSPPRRAIKLSDKEIENLTWLETRGFVNPMEANLYRRTGSFAPSTLQVLSSADGIFTYDTVTGDLTQRTTSSSARFNNERTRQLQIGENTNTALNSLLEKWAPKDRAAWNSLTAYAEDRAEGDKKKAADNVAEFAKVFQSGEFMPWIPPQNRFAGDRAYLGMMSSDQFITLYDAWEKVKESRESYFGKNLSLEDVLGSGLYPSGTNPEALMMQGAKLRAEIENNPAAMEELGALLQVSDFSADDLQKLNPIVLMQLISAMQFEAANE